MGCQGSLEGLRGISGCSKLDINIEIFLNVYIQKYQSIFLHAKMDVFIHSLHNLNVCSQMILRKVASFYWLIWIAVCLNVNNRLCSCQLDSYLILTTFKTEQWWNTCTDITQAGSLMLLVVQIWIPTLQFWAIDSLLLFQLR